MNVHNKVQYISDIDLALLENIRKGNKIIATKEYMLVFFITCFVPFIRPSFPMIRDNEIAKLKQTERDNVKKRRLHASNQVDGVETIFYDQGLYDKFKKIRDDIENKKYEGKNQSIFVNLYERDMRKKHEHEHAF